MASTEGPGAGPGQPEWPRPAWPNPEWPAAPATSPGWGSPPPPVPSQSPPPGPPPPAPPGNEEIGIGPNTRCYEHPDRLAGSICRSCNKPICADCMVQAPVGWHCRQCVRKNAKKSPVIRYRPGTGALPTLSQVPMTMGLIAICVALYIASSADPNLLNDTAMQGQAVQSGQWYRLFTSIFFHLDILHIGLNMVSLLIIGRLVEPILGKWRYLALFLVSGSRRFCCVLPVDVRRVSWSLGCDLRPIWRIFCPCTPGSRRHFRHRRPDRDQPLLQLRRPRDLLAGPHRRLGYRGCAGGRLRPGPPRPRP